MKTKIFTLALLLTAATAAWAQTGPVTMSKVGDTYTGTFTQPAYDVEVTTELWYKLSETATDNQANYGTKTNVFLERTLQSLTGDNKGWNTFCAPFAISAAKVTALGMTVKAFTGATLSDGTLTLNFETASSIAAGTPYLVQVASELDLTADGNEFAGITQDWTANTVAPTGSAASFVPVLVPEEMDANDETKLFVTGGNTLTFPNTTGNINAFRAYFKLHDLPESARAFVLNFGDETGIQSIDNLTIDDLRFDGGTYTIDGRKVQNTTRKGVYIKNGRKVVIK